MTMLDMAEVLLYAMWQQAENEGRWLIVEEKALGHAMADIDGYGRHVHVSPAGGDGELRVVFT